MRGFISIVLGLFFLCSWGARGMNARYALPVQVVISVDWEGYSLEPDNLAAFRKFREDYPQIKIIHFLNPAYFTKTNAQAEEINNAIRSVLRPGDELGLHIHAFESLLKVAGVPFRQSVTYWGHAESQWINGDRGHDVPLSLYTTDEMQSLVHTSLEILHSNGFSPIQAFRAGGWVATPEVLEAIAREGILVDSSAVSTEFIERALNADLPLLQITKQLWPSQTPDTDQLYQINMPAGIVTEVPNNFALADYLTGEQAFSTFEKIIPSRFESRQPLMVHFGFHQETAAIFISRVRTFLDKLYLFSRYYMIDIQSHTFDSLRVQDLNKSPIGLDGIGH